MTRGQRRLRRRPERPPPPGGFRFGGVDADVDFFARAGGSRSGLGVVSTTVRPRPLGAPPPAGLADAGALLQLVAGGAVIVVVVLAGCLAGRLGARPPRPAPDCSRGGSTASSAQVSCVGCGSRHVSTGRAGAGMCGTAHAGRQS